MRTSRRALLAALLWGALSVAAGAEPARCPGAGAGGEEDGLGGTGLGGDEDGIGGTGIHGVISALGSLCINGLHVELADGAQVLRDGTPVAASALGVGQVAWLVARDEGGRLVSDRIEIHSALLGPLEAMADGRLRVAGVELELPANLDALDLAAGDPVAVSGLWRDDDTLLATRVERLDDAVPAQRMPPLDLSQRGRGLARLSVEGFATAVRSGPQLLGLALSGAPGELPRAGERIRLIGRPTDTGGLRVEGVFRPGPRALPRDPPTAPPAERPPRPETAPRPVRPDRIERPSSIDRIEPVDRMTPTR